MAGGIVARYFVDRSGDDAAEGFGENQNASVTTEKGTFSELNSQVVINYLNNSSYKQYGSYTAGSPSDTNHPSLMGEKVVYSNDK